VTVGHDGFYSSTAGWGMGRGGHHTAVERGGSRPDRQDVGGRQWPGRGARVRAVGTEQGRAGVTDPWAPTTVPGGGSLNLFQIQIQNEFESDSNCLKL
jgi:hypothetical protein